MFLFFLASITSLALPVQINHAFFFGFPCLEKRLHSMNQLSDHPTSMEYFWPDRPVSHIEDDHIPFLNRGATQVTQLPRNTRCRFCFVFFADCSAVSFWQAFRSSTSFPPPSLPCGTPLTTTSRTWIAPPLRTSTRSCRSSSWNTSMPGPTSLQVHRQHFSHAEQILYLAEI